MAETSSNSSSSNSSSGGGGLWGAVGQIGSTLVTGIFGNAKAKKELELKAQEQHFQQSLQGLTNEQNYILNQQLANATDDVKRLQILTDAVTKVKLQQQQNSSSSGNQKVILVLGVMIVLVIVLIVVNKNK